MRMLDRQALAIALSFVLLPRGMGRKRLRMAVWTRLKAGEHS
jgi:hypothetical protein